MSYTLGNQHQYKKNFNNVYDHSISTHSQMTSNNIPKLKSLQYPCRIHNDEYCHNYCVESKCFKPLCSECIEEHVMHHKKIGLSDLGIKSFRAIRVQCTRKLDRIIERLLQKMSSLKDPKNPEQIINEIDEKLSIVMRSMQQILQYEINKLQQVLKNKVKQSYNAMKSIQDIHDNLKRIIAELQQHNKIIIQGILTTTINSADSIQKTIKLEEQAIYNIFDKQCYAYNLKTAKIDYDITFNSDLFRNNIHQSLKIKSSVNNYQQLNHVRSRQEKSSSHKSRSKSKSPSKATYLTQDNFSQQILQIRKPQILSQYRCLHYFASNSDKLHFIKFDKSSEGFIYHEIQKLAGFIIPDFHASILLQKSGLVLISGGKQDLLGSQTKSKVMSKYSMRSNEFILNFTIVRPRSSHTLCEDPLGEFVYILGGYGQPILNASNEMQTTFEKTLEKVNLRSGEVIKETSSRWGGSNLSVALNNVLLKSCCEGVEVYNLLTKNWSEVKTIGNQANFYRGTGYTVLSNDTVLVYGGYDKHQKGISECSLWKLVFQGTLTLQKMRLECKLPFAEGFWNNPGITDRENIYALQNIQDQEQQNQFCLQNERRIIKLAIRSGQKAQWSVLQAIKTKNSLKN